MSMTHGIVRGRGKSLFNEFFGEDFNWPTWSNVFMKEYTECGPVPLRADAFRDGDEIVIHLDVPGKTKEDMIITVRDGVLRVSCVKDDKREKRKKNFYFIERKHESYERVFDVPKDLSPNTVKASCKNGLLEIRFPLSDQVDSKEPKQIKIE